MSKQTDFINIIKDGAIAGAKSGILASVTIAQAIEESGWGDHASHYNLFGIKADTNYKGETFNMPTTEEVNGQTEHITATFRTYQSFAESIANHTQFLLTNSQYNSIIGDMNAIRVCQKLQSAGYATDSNYASELIGLIQQYNLTQYDHIIQTMPHIQKGSTGDAVKTLQTVLNSVGYVGKDGLPLKVDGIFGDNTEYAVIRRQQDGHMTADGLVWYDTWLALGFNSPAN